MKLKLLSCLIAGLFNLGGALAQSGGYALNFDGSDDYIDLPNVVDIGASSNTVELWLKVPTIGTGGMTGSERVGSVLGAYNSAPHFNYEIYSNGSPRIYWNAGEVNAIAGSAHDLRDGKWHHLAYVRDTVGDEFRIYKDGVLIHSVTGVGSDLVMTDAHKIGADNRSGGGPKFHGSMDEIRIWNVARTEAEIRASMCSRIDTAETGLLHYYNVDASTGNILTDLVSGNDGTLNNFALTGTASNWLASGAAIGDTSVSIYPTSFTGQSLNLSSAKGDITIDAIQNSAAGIHLYRVDGLPSSVSGIKALATNSVYYGVFVAHDTALSYDVSYDYSPYALAVANEDSLFIYNRASGDSVTWMEAGFSRMKANDMLEKSGVSGDRNEFILGNFSGYVCSAPSGLDTSNVTFNSADLAWTSGGAAIWDVEYGPSGFALGSGTLDSGIVNNPHAITGLTPSTNYEFYVRDNCGTLGISEWVGPFSFTTKATPACVNPANFSLSSVTAYSASFTVTSLSGNSNIEYGPAGFNQGTGIFEDSIMSSSFSVYDLQPSTSYDIYIQDTCNMLNSSSWVGPITFTTPRGFIQGRENAINFDGDDDFIQMANVLPVGDTSNTFETWLRVPVAGTEGLEVSERVGILLGSYGVPVNFNYEIFSNGAPRVWWNAGEINSTASATDVDLRDGKWHHLAYVRDEVADEFRIFVDGELVHTANGAGTDITMTTPHRIGGDNRDAGGGPSFHGDLDEIRIWKTARTEAEIRANMCQTISASEADLLHYYSLEGSVEDFTSNDNDGTMTNFTNPAGWVVSGAAIGNASDYLHGGSFAGLNLSLTSADRGDVEVSSVTGDLNGIYLYRVDTVPNTENGILDIADQDVHYGVFVSKSMGSGTCSYDVSYDYSNYPNATVNEANLSFYNRAAGNIPMWTNSGATLDVNTDKVDLSNVISRKEFVLADFTASPCSYPRDLNLIQVTPDSAEISWNSTSPTQMLQYGPSGFALDSGRIERGVTSSHTLSGLNYLTAYDVYVGDTCAASGAVMWTGPLTFTTADPCPSIDSVVVSTVTGNSATFEIYPLSLNEDVQIQWGSAGFTKGLGIVSSATGNPAHLLNLSKSFSYDAYFRIDCDSISSEWVGPVSFSTDSAGGFSIDDSPLASAINIYPNPSSGQFTLTVDHADQFDVSILSLKGAVVHREGTFDGGRYEKAFDLSHLPKGVYVVRLNTAIGSSSRRLIIR